MLPKKGLSFIGVNILFQLHIGKCRYICSMELVDIFKALSNKTRLEILSLLREPEKNFPLQDKSENIEGVCVGHIQKKLGITQSTVSEYLSILQRTGLVTANRKGQWTYYKRNEEVIKQVAGLLEKAL